MPVAEAETTQDTQQETKERVVVTWYVHSDCIYFHIREKFTEEQLEHISSIDGVTSVRDGDTSNDYTARVSYGKAFEPSEVAGEVLYAIAGFFGIAVDSLDVQADRDRILRNDNTGVWIDTIVDNAKQIELEELEDDLELITVGIRLADKAGETLRALRSQIEEKLANS